MYSYLFQGLLLGFSYVAPIGMQNLYVINTAIRGNKVKAYQVALITIFFDITLALACFFGVGLLLERIPNLEAALLSLGSLLVIYIGISLIRTSGELTEKIEINQSIFKVAVACFVVTWLNPQALIDGSLLLGGYSASVPSGLEIYFIFGFCAASFFWFMFLATLMLKLKSKLNAKIIKGINVTCGFILIFFGLKLGYSFLELMINL